MKKVQRFDLVQISRGGVTHAGNYGVTQCGKSYDTGTAIYTATDDVTCKSCIKIEARTDELEAQLHPKPEPTIQAERGPVNMDAKAQADGVALRRAGMALVGNCHYNTWSARLAFTHGFFSLHESCECKISGDVGYTYDLATHTMIKNPPARHYTQAELDLAWRRLGGFERGNGKHKGSKARRVRSHA